MRLQSSKGFPSQYSFREHINLLVKFYLTTSTHYKREMFSKHISSTHGRTKGKDTGMRRNGAHLKTDEASSKVLHLSKVLKNQETHFELSWMPITHCEWGEGGMHFETYIFCLSEMGSLSQCTGDMTRRTEAALGGKCPPWVSSGKGGVWQLHILW